MGAEPWGLYPPEVNAGRYDAGVGPAAWIASAVEWGAMSAMVTEAIAALGLQVGSITGDWHGMASQRFGAATVPYAQWLTEMAAVANLNVQRSIGVVQAYAAGRTSMVPLAVILANRAAARTAQLAGVLGAPNTEMVRLEIEYGGFWSHNATVMSGYDAAVTAATAHTPVRPPPTLVVDAVPGGSPEAHLQQLSQQAGQHLGQPTGNPITAPRSVSPGFLNRYAGPSLGESSTLSRMLGSGAGTGAAFGGRSTADGASYSARGGGSGIDIGVAGGGVGLLAPPLASFSPTTTGAALGQTGPAFGGVQNTAGAARPAVPMAPPMGHGSRLRQSLDERNQETVMAAEQEFAAAPARSGTAPESSGQEILVPTQLR